MYTALSISELIIRGINGGNFTADQKPDPNYIFEQLPRWRAMAISLFYNGGKVPNSNTIIKGSNYINPDNYQDKEYVLDPNIQDNTLDYLIFEGNSVLTPSNSLGGVQYCGSIKQVNNFFTAKTRIEIQELKDLGFFGIKPIVVVEGDNRLVYGSPLLKKWYERALYNNPYFSDPNFNYETSKFPICEQVANLMKAIAVAELAPEFRSIKDITADGGNLEANIVKNAIA